MKGCQHTDHLKMELIKEIIRYEHKTECFEAWLYDLRALLESKLDKYKINSKTKKSSNNDFKKTCPKCEGVGEIRLDSISKLGCTACGGTGFIKS